MSSLRAVVSAASLGSKRWFAVSSSVLRNGCVFAQKKAVLACEKNFSSTALCLSGDKDINLEHAATSSRENSQPIAPEGNNANELKSQISVEVEAPKSQVESSGGDGFEEIISTSNPTFSGRLRRFYKNKLTLWQQILREAERQGKPINLENILTDSFPDVVEFSLTPLALPEVRSSLLKILLTQQSDNEHLARILKNTIENVMQLPIGDVAEILRLLSLATPTELRTESRRALVSAVVNRRWYEVTAKHLLLVMFQMDDLFDVKTISKQLRQKSKEKEKELSSKKKRKSSKSPAETNSTGSEGTLTGSCDVDKAPDGEANKAELKEEQAAGVKDEKETALDCLASVNIESRATDLADDLKVKDLARVLSLLSRWNSRNEPLLNACLHRLSLADLSSFTLTQLSSQLQAMANLRLHHSRLLENTTHQLSNKLMDKSPSPAQVCAILQALSLLRWTGQVQEQDGEEGAFGKNLVRQCVSYLSRGQDQLTVKEASGALTSFANLSQTALNDEERAIVSGLARLVMEGKSPWWGKVQCVWCLSVLQCLDASMLHSVLNSRFVEQVLQKVKESADPVSPMVSANKLAQINTAARLEVKGYDGPFLTDDQLDLCTQTTSVSSDQKAAKAALANTLRKFVDLVTYVDLNPTMLKGITADALMCANHNGEFRPLETKAKSDSTGTEAEPRLSLALQHIPFSGVNSPENSATGQYQMNARHLDQLGYTPVQIFYSDLKPSLSILEKVNNIKARVKTAVSASNSSTTTAHTEAETSSRGGPQSGSATNSTPADVATDQTPHMS